LSAGKKKRLAQRKVAWEEKEAVEITVWDRDRGREDQHAKGELDWKSSKKKARPSTTRRERGRTFLREGKAGRKTNPKTTQQEGKKRKE